MSTFRPNEILNLTVDLYFESDQILRVKIYDKNNARYEVPLNVNGGKFKKSINSDYYVSISNVPFAIKVFRKSTGNIMFVCLISILMLIYLDLFIFN